MTTTPEPVAKGSRITAVRFALREAWALSPRSSLLALLELLLRLAEALQPVFFALIVTGIATGTWSFAIAGGTLLALETGAGMLLTFIGITHRVSLMAGLTARFEGRTARLLASIPTTAHLHDPTMSAKVQLLRDLAGGIGGTYNMVLNALRWMLAPIATVAVAVTADWRLILVVLAAVPQLFITSRISSISQKHEEAAADDSKRLGALMDIAASRPGGSEARTFGARGFLRAELRAAAQRWQSVLLRGTARTSALTLAMELIYLAAAVGVLVWMGMDAVAGTVSLGAMTVALTSLSGLQQAAGGVRTAITTLDDCARSVARYLWLEDYARGQAEAHAGTALPPAGLADRIRLRNVSFTHPGASSPVFDDLTLDLPAGSTIALVGENGAGKTTLVELLIGLHDLDSGSIDVDGVPLADMDLAAWRAQCAGAFQDHANIEATARETITVGDLGGDDSADSAMRALERASATDVLTALPHGLDTQLGTSWPDGVGLSGGQWQRLAIARGMMRTAPLLRILDEPTSALDPETEDRLFRKYAAAAEETSAAGGITLLITHRFSTVSAADRVVVLDHGRVVEQGTHRELMAARGQYYDMFTVQARGYAPSQHTD